MKFFQKMSMASETVNSFMRSGLMVDSSGNKIAVDSGAFVVSKGLVDNEVYSQYVAGTKDLNTFTIAAPVTAEVTSGGLCLYVVDPVKVSSGDIAGNVYREGAKTLGLGADAGEITAMRKLVVDDYFVLGADNFTGAPTVGKFAVLTAGLTTLTPAATKAATGMVIQIEAPFALSEGITPQNGYICRVIQL